MHQKEMEETKDEAEKLAEMNPIDLPKKSMFLLEMDGTKSVNNTFNDLNSWIEAVEAAKVAGRRTVNEKSTKRKHNQGMNDTEMRLKRLGVRRVEREIEKDTKERAEIDCRSRRDKEQMHKKT